MSDRHVSNLDIFRKKLEGETICLGMVVWLTDPNISEIAGDAGFDFTWIDMEHGALNIETVLEHVRAARGTDMAPIVRVPWNDPVLIKPVLDFAPAGVIIPMVNTREEAEKAVAACRYPLEGVRGCGGIRRGARYGAEPFGEYLDKSKNDPMIIIQIEHIKAVENLDEILKVKGIDSICVGPGDLSASMGKLGDSGNIEVEDTIDLICRKAQIAGVMVGSVGGTDNVDKWIKRGAKWLAVTGDASMIFNTSVNTIKEIRKIEEQGK